MIAAHNILMIGSSGRNTHKTELACALIRRFSPNHRIIAVKASTLDDGESHGSVDGPYAFVEETTAGPGKDTQRFRAAGAAKAYWMRVAREHLEEGARALCALVGREGFVICESNSLRAVMEPGLFLMVWRGGAASIKPSARAVWPWIDRIVTPVQGLPEESIQDIEIEDGRWRLRPMKGARP